MKTKIHLVGATTDGKMVMGGVAAEYYENGLPLSVIFIALQKYNAVPSWPRLYDDLQKNGMTHKRIMHLLNEHVGDSYEKEFKDVVIDRLELYAKS